MKKLTLLSVAILFISTSYASNVLPPPTQCSTYYYSHWIGSPMGIQDDFNIYIGYPADQNTNENISASDSYYAGRFGGMLLGNCIQNSDGTVTLTFHSTTQPTAKIILNSLIGTDDIVNISGYAANQINGSTSLVGQMTRV